MNYVWYNLASAEPPFLYNYAYYNRALLGKESIFLYNKDGKFRKSD